MARFARGVKTKAIRDYISENPMAGPAAIAAGLKEKGLSVKVTHVASVKYGDQHKQPKQRRRRQPAVHIAVRRTAAGSVTVEHLIQVKEAADSLGGIEQLRQALDTLEQLR